MKIFVFQKEISLFRGETREIVFTPEEFPQLKIDNPRLWWPLFKGKPDLYELKMTVSVKGQVSDSLKTRFGIREITSDQNTPDKSRQFYVNGKKIYIDHRINSIQNYMSPDLRHRYDMIDVNVYQEKYFPHK